MISVPYAIYAGYIHWTNILGMPGGFSDNTDHAASPIWNTNADDIYYNGGNVGIGIANPTESLALYGGLMVIQDNTQYYDGLRVYSPGGSTNGYMVMGVNIPDTGRIQVYDNGGGMVDLGLTLQPEGGWVGIGVNTFNDDARLQVANPSSRATVRFTDTGGSFCMTNGRIGIGTDAPSNALHVFDPTGIILDRSSANYGAGLYFAEAGTQLWRLKVDNDGGNNNKMQFATGDAGQELITIQTDGNTGIGTTTPQGALEIARYTGSSILGTPDDVSTYQLALNGIGGNINDSAGIVFTRESWPTASVVGIDSGANQQGDLLFFVNGSAAADDMQERMRIKSSGYIGIGTANPEALFNVHGPGKSAQFSYYYSWAQPVDQSIYIGARNGQVCNVATAVGWKMRVHTPGGGGTPTSFIFESGYESAWVNGPPDTFIERMRITGNGEVGIGTDIPDQLLTVNGDASKIGGGTWQNFSDERLKDIHGSFCAGLKEIISITPISYSYKENNDLKLRTGGKYIGLSAQEVQRYIPEAVTTNRGGYLMLNYDPVIFAMLNSIKELNAENIRLRDELDKLRDSISR